MRKIKGTEWEKIVHPKPMTPDERRWEHEFDRHLESGATLADWFEKKLEEKT